MKKQSIRDRYLNLRLTLSEREYNRLSHDLCVAFFSAVEWSAVTTVHIFLPMVSKKEPNTWLIIEQLEKEFPEIRIAVPKMTGENSLTNFYYSGRNQIQENKWGIPEPQSGDQTPLEKIDLVIVPLLAFDVLGNRIGYGKGFYDRFLKGCRSDCKKVGLSFFDPVDEIADIESHDVKLNQVITPSRVFTVN